MTAIQAATINVAKTFKKDKDYGSVEPGKVADLSIIEGDPFKDIWMTQNVKMVVMDGKLIDVAFQKYENPIPSFSTLTRRCRASTIHRAGEGRARGRPHRAEREGRRNVAIPPRLPERRSAAHDVQEQDRARSGRSPRTFPRPALISSQSRPTASASRVHRAHLIVSFD